MRTKTWAENFLNGSEVLLKKYFLKEKLEIQEKQAYSWREVKKLYNIK